MFYFHFQCFQCLLIFLELVVGVLLFLMVDFDIIVLLLGGYLLIDYLYVDIAKALANSISQGFYFSHFGSNV